MTPGEFKLYEKIRVIKYESERIQGIYLLMIKMEV